MMRANEILNEASVVNKLKSASNRKRKNAGKSAFRQMTKQLADRPETLSPGSQSLGQMINQLSKRKGMKVKKTDPRTALGSKGITRSPEYQAALAQLQQNKADQENLTKTATEPATATQPQSTATPAPTQSKPTQPQATQATQSKPTATPAPTPVSVAGTSVPGIDQRVLTKAVVGSINQITDPGLLKTIKSNLDNRLGLK